MENEFKIQLHDEESIRLPRNFWYKTVNGQKIPSTNLIFLYSLIDKIYPDFDRRVDTISEEMKENLARILARYTFKPVTAHNITWPLVCSIGKKLSDTDGINGSYKTYDELYREYLFIR